MRSATCAKFIALCCLLTAHLGAGVYVSADDGIDFFEQKIRPVLVERCYACHSTEAANKQNLKGALFLDSREALRKGGYSGPAIVPGKPNESLLIAAIRHDTIEMPPKEKLPTNVIADFERWI